MRTTAQEVAEAAILDARLLALHAEKARIDADIASTTEDLRRLFEDHMVDILLTPTVATGSSADRPARRRRTNLADTTTATSIACLLRISERAAHRLVQHSSVLLNYQPATHQALHDGLISWQHATTIIDECTGLPEPTAALLEDELLSIAGETTAARVSYRARRLRTRLHPESLHQRAESSRSRRRVDFDADRDGMAWLHVHLPASEATAIDGRLTHGARALQAPSETRTLAQLRTDVLVDLLLAETVGIGKSGGRVAEQGQDGSVSSGVSPRRGTDVGAGRIRAHINVTVPVLTLLGVDDEPADLEGYGPIPADVARRLAAHAPSFTRLLTHPETGVVMSVGRTAYAVPADLKRWLRVRDRTCRHPGCTVPASRCEIDHTTPWSQGGSTSHDNLAHLCRKHHKLKSEGVWHYTQSSVNDEGHVTSPSSQNRSVMRAGPSVLTATSPFGRTYLSRPDPAPF